MTTQKPDNYPAHRVVDVTLRDGTTIHVRPVLPEDIYEVNELFARLSDESVRNRFHARVRTTTQDLRPFVEVDYSQTFGLVAETAQGDEFRVVALASYVGTGPSTAEVAIVIDDPFQGKGLGSILLEHLAEAAEEAGLGCFAADVLASNTEMLEVLRALELPLTTTASAGVLHVEFPTSLTPAAIEAFERREAVAAAAGVAAFLQPSSVAVIGASRKRGTIGAEIFHNLLQMGFTGPVFPVNPTADVVQSVPAFCSILDVPQPVDLAVVVVPAAHVKSVVAECGQKGVKALLIISAGFAEVGPEGRAAQTVSSHTASIAVGDIAVDALFRQTGVIRTDTLEQLFEVASLLAHQPLPRGNKVAILTNAGGLGILCADACEAGGLTIPELSKATRDELAGFLAAEASVTNPVDMIASASAEQYGRALEVLGRDPEIDSIVVIFIPPLVTRAEDVANAVREAARNIGKTVLSCFLGVQGIHGLLGTGARTIPSFSFPESAGHALASVTSYATWRSAPEGSIPTFEDTRRTDALSLVARYAGSETRWLEPSAVDHLLSCYGIRVAKARTGDVGAEMFVGVSHDPSFGPLVACGAGGTLVELLRDVSVRVTPLTDKDADQMVTSLKTYPLFQGYRGQPALDEGAFRELLLRISALVEDAPHLLELDLNPVLVLEEGEGCVVLDARMKIGLASPVTPRGARTSRARK